MQINEFPMSFRLEQWGLWSWTENPMSDPMHPIAVMMQKPSTLPKIEITDEEALEIDRAVGVLKNHHDEFWRAIIAHYRYQQNYSEVAQYLNVNRRNAAEIVKAATAWVEGALIMNRAA